MNIAFIIGPQSLKWDGTYYDKFLYEPYKKEYQRTIPKSYLIEEKGKKYTVSSKSKPFVRIDVSIAYGILYYLNNKKTKIKFDIIFADEITFEKLNKYDLIINQFMDLLIVPYIPKFSKNGVPHEKLRLIYEKLSHKIYPPMNYQNMIYDKCKYYTFLQKHKFKTSPFFCVYNSKEKTLTNSLNYFKSESKLFVKPIHGTDSVNTNLLQDTQLKTLKRYAKKILPQKKYLGFIIQPFFKEFEQNVPQVRLYHVGTKYMYTVLNDSKGTYRPKSEVSTDFKHEKTIHVKDLEKLKLISQKIIRKIKEVYFKKIPLLITRIDFGCCLASMVGSQKYFVNEIEFNPGMYLHTDGLRRFNMDDVLISQFIKIINLKLKK